MDGNINFKNVSKNLIDQGGAQGVGVGREIQHKGRRQTEKVNERRGQREIKEEDLRDHAEVAETRRRSEKSPILRGW